MLDCSFNTQTHVQHTYTNFSTVSVNKTFSTSLSTQSSSDAEVTDMRVIVLRSLFIISAILLIERSPVQFETIDTCRAGFPYKQTKHVLRALGRRGLPKLAQNKKLTSLKSHVHCAELHNYLKFSRIYVGRHRADRRKQVNDGCAKKISISSLINFVLRSCHLSSDG